MTSAEAVEIRPAGPDDADPLGHCHLDCWSEAYRGLVDGPGFRAELTRVDERVERWRQVLAGPHGTVVAVIDGDVAGFASAGPQRDDDVDLPLELYALYVRQARWGTGLGHRLLQAVVGDAPGSLWVLGTNERARTFYSRHGYRCDGAEKHDDIFGTEVRMVRRPCPALRQGDHDLAARRGGLDDAQPASAGWSSSSRVPPPIRRGRSRGPRRAASAGGARRRARPGSAPG